MKTNFPTKEHPLFDEIAEIARTDFSRILLARELRTKKLAILKVASQDIKMQGSHLSNSEKAANNESIENEVRVWQSIYKRGTHPALPELLAVKKDGSFLAVDKSTQSNYVAEPYYSGMTLADLINNRGYLKKRFVYIIRSINLSLLRFFCRFTTPNSPNMLRWFGVPNRLIVPTRQITSGKPLPVHQAVSFIHQMANGLDHLHTSTNAYIHLDLKPTNIMLKRLQRPGHESSKEIVIIDLGESRPQDSRATMGTPWWRPVEQVNIIKISGNKRINDSQAHPSMDIYSLGQIFGYLLTGVHPENLKTQQYMDLVSRFSYPVGTSTKRKNELSTSIVAILKRCLANDPALRPSAKAIGLELSKIEKNLPRPGVWQWWLMLATLLLTIILMFSILLTIMIPPKFPPQPTATIVPPTELAVTAVTPSATFTATAEATSTPAPTTTDIPKPTVTPTPSLTISPGSALTLTNIVAVSTVTPFTILTPTPMPTLIIKILLSAPSEGSGIQNCNDLGSWSLTTNTKIAFTVEGPLEDNDIYDLQLILPGGEEKIIDSSKSAEGGQNPNFRKSRDEQHYMYDGIFTSSHLQAWGIPPKPNSGTYQWRILIRRGNQIIGQSSPCNFNFADRSSGNSSEKRFNEPDQAARIEYQSSFLRWAFWKKEPRAVSHYYLGLPSIII